jgi:hypothetical protein
MLGLNFIVSISISDEKTDIMKMEAAGLYAALALMYHTTLYHFPEFRTLKFIAAV